MNWEAIGAIAELMGALGVIVTLGYLAFQIRQNTNSNRTSALQLTSDQDAEFWSLISGDAQLAEIMLRGNRELRELDEVEGARFSAINMQLYRHWDCQLELYHAGIIPDHFWASAERGMVASLSMPGVQAWWRNSREMFTPQVQQRIDSILAERLGLPEASLRRRAAAGPSA